MPTQLHTEYSDEEKDAVYALFNAKTEGVDGVSQADFFKVMVDIKATI